MEFDDLPDGWAVLRLSDPTVAVLNPKKTEVRGVPDSTAVTFVPMSAVDDASGTIARPEVRSLVAVRKGYTYFTDGDVIFAKITPCMENGKSAVARDLRNKIGFGSTEFHVVRPGADATAEWLHMLLRSQQVRDAAENSMHGAAGQQRVPVEFLEQLEIPVPPLAEQRRLVGRIAALTGRLAQARQARQAAIAEAEMVEMAYLEKIRRLAIERSWKTALLGEITRVIMGQSPKGDTYNLNGEGVPLLNGPTEFGEEHPTPRQWTTHPQRRCETGDILFCVRGATTGRMNWADRTYSLGRGLAAIRPSPDVCLPMYVYGFLKTQAQVILHQGEGSIFPNFNKDQLKGMQIVLPPLREQEKIVSDLTQLRAKLDELRGLQREVEAELAAFTPALLAKAFRGEL